MNRSSLSRDSGTSYTQSSGRLKSKDEPEKGLWSSMLDSVATGKRLPEKNLIVFGGSPDSQKEFLETLESDVPSRPQDRHRKRPIVANSIALGYTYHNVLDADHEDILARLSIYLLAEPLPPYTALLAPLLTPQSIPESLLVILLDWNEPWAWVRQLRDWIIFLRAITASLSEESKVALDETMKQWQEKIRGTASYDASGTSSANDASVTIPLSQGEWDEPLGLPLCVVCQNASNINALEVEHNWREEDFDFVLQALRTILMKHGASLIYTSISMPNSLPTLVHSSLDIHSMLKKQTLKHSVLDRDKILVPPSWDSWGKIRVIREGFDVEDVSGKWAVDISQPLPNPDPNNSNPDRKDQSADLSSQSSPVVELYEATISDPYAGQKAEAKKKPEVEVSVPNMQSFLASQQETLSQLAAEDEKAVSSAASTSSTFTNNTAGTSFSTHDRMTEQIGPVQVNMGGIQVDAEDVVKKLQNQARGQPSKEGDSTPRTKKEGANMSTPEMTSQNEALTKFFDGLMKRGVNSPRGTPSKATPKADSK